MLTLLGELRGLFGFAPRGLVKVMQETLRALKER
jgi:hypothetical protein